MSIKYESMDDSDIRHYLGKNARILTYNELAQFKTIEKLLPKHGSYFVLLYPVRLKRTVIGYASHALIKR